MAEPADKLPADRIDVTLFREVLLLPFAIGPAPGDTPANGPRTYAGAERMVEIARQLDGSAWQPVEDPLRHLPDDRRAEPENRERRARMLASAYEEFVYFQPYVQRFLYGGTRADNRLEPIALYSRDDVTGLELDFPWENDRNRLRRFTFAVERCNLYLFETGNAMLALEIRFERVEPCFPAASEAEQTRLASFRLADAEQLLECVRRVFPPFFTVDPDAGLEPFLYADNVAWLFSDEKPRWENQVSVDPVAMIEHVFGEKGAARSHRSPPIFEPWRELLAPLVVEGTGIEGLTPPMILRQSGDDRAFVMAQIGVADMLRIKRSDWVRLCFADAPGAPGVPWDDYPYAEAFLADFERDNCYDRFFERFKESWWKTRTMVCNFSFVMVGNCATKAKAPNDFFRNVIAKHFRRHYFQLVLISLFQKTALLTLSERLASALDRLEPAAEDSGEPGFHDEVHRLQKEVMQFTHRYWFEDISAQLQAKELFDLLRRQLGTRPLYEQLSKEIGESYGRLELERQTRLSETANSLNQIAGLGLVLAIATGFFGMNLLIPTDSHWLLDILYFLLCAGITLAALTYARSKNTDLFAWTLERWRRFKHSVFG